MAIVNTVLQNESPTWLKSFSSSKLLPLSAACKSEPIRSIGLNSAKEILSRHHSGQRLSTVGRESTMASLSASRPHSVGEWCTQRVADKARHQGNLSALSRVLKRRLRNEFVCSAGEVEMAAGDVLRVDVASLERTY